MIIPTAEYILSHVEAKCMRTLNSQQNAEHYHTKWTSNIFKCYEDRVEVFKDKPLYIANGLMDGIEMEADLRRNHPDKKLSILNMMVWI